MNKKDEELKFGKFFIERFNQRYKLNYQAFSNDEEASDVDIYATAENHETLKLQLKTGEPALKYFWGSRKKRGTGGIMINGNIEKILEQIIKDGEQKYSNKEDLLFLITEEMSPVFDKEYVRHVSRGIHSTFKGIYLIKLPINLKISPPYEEQVVALKDIFGNHGEVF